MRLALAGDAMLGRKVAEALAAGPPERLVDDAVVAAAREADLFVLNLECCISERGEPWPDPFKPFFFRAPPIAVELLAHMGVSCVTLANNHALDFGEQALLDTFDHLEAAGIGWAGAGWDVERARAPVLLEAAGTRLALVAFADHPADYAAIEDRPGIAYADVRDGPPGWVLEGASTHEADVVLVAPHWGPNMVADPVRSVRSAARRLEEAGATLVAGHSAHVFHGVERRILYDLGGFLDDYRVDPLLRNDLGLLVLVDLDGARPVRLEALPLELEYCRTRLATGAEAAWVGRRFREACAALGTDVREERGRLVIDFPKE
jgi:poly-gamma-glutamate synthesis protein (capsule biosynthesis protein)